jgi:outer membrane protein
MLSSPWWNPRCIRRPMHPASLRCSSLKNSPYSRSSRLAIRAPRPSRCDAGVPPRAARGSGWATLAVFLAAAAPGVARAQDQPVQPVLTLSLADARARALETSHRLAEARAREAATLAGVDSRVAAEKPLVTASAGYTRTNHVLEFVVPSPTGAPRVLYPDVPDNYRTRLDVQWPIYSGGRTDALVRAARVEAGAATAETAVARADLRLEVSRVFWAVVTGSATVTVLEQAVSRADANVADARARLTAGLVPPNEVASAEAQAARQRMLLVEARNLRDVSAADLARLVGAGPGQQVEPRAALEDAVAPVAARDALASEARQQRAERKLIEQRIDLAGASRAVAEAARRPQVAVAGGVDYARPNPRIFPRADRWDESWDAGVSLTLSLWDGGRSAAEIAQASFQGEAARQRLLEFDAGLSVEVTQRSLEIASGQAAVAAADEAIRAATEARRVVGERYRAGVIAQSEVLDAELVLVQVQLDRTRALAGVRLAEARLDRALGR